MWKVPCSVSTRKAKGGRMTYDQKSQKSATLSTLKCQWEGHVEFRKDARWSMVVLKSSLRGRTSDWWDKNIKRSPESIGKTLLKFALVACGILCWTLWVTDVKRSYHHLLIELADLRARQEHKYIEQLLINFRKYIIGFRTSDEEKTLTYRLINFTCDVQTCIQLQNNIWKVEYFWRLQLCKWFGNV